MEHGIVLKPEVLGYIGFLPVTNTLLVSWIVMFILLVVSIFATWRLKLVPSGLQNFMEMIIEGGYNIVSDIAGNRTKVFFPFVFTFFLYIIFANLIGLLPGFTTLLSLSFRLFGNIFAGEVVLATIAGIFAFVLPLPFYFLEIVVGFVQAAVFMMLTLVFMVLLTEKHEAEH